jgi:soluble lytic murein transglycosylase-like protein
MAIQAEDRQDMDATKALLAAAAAHETGLYARIAAERYLRLLKAEADGPGLLAFAGSEGGRNLSPWARASMEAEALSMTGRYAQALNAWIRLRADHPEGAKDNETTLRAGVLHAAIGAGTPEALHMIGEEFRGLLGLTGNEGWYKAMSAVLEAMQAHPVTIAGLNEQDLILAQARVLSGTREYGASVLAFRRYHALSYPSPTAGPGPLGAEDGALLASSLDRAALSDLARALLFGSRAEGQAIFTLLASQAAATTQAAAATQATAVQEVPPTAYLHLFWAGRFARAAERWREAATLFSAAAALAPDPADLDAALWYEAETRSKYSPAEAVAVLARAYASTTNPAYYSDLLEPLSRKALTDRSGTLLAAILSAAAPAGGTASGATARDRARLDYLGARAAATGIITAAQLQRADPDGFAAPISAYVEAALNRAYQQDADPWYRLLAAYHLGLPLVEPADGPGAPEPPPGPLVIAEDQTMPTQSDTPQTAPGQAVNAEPAEQESVVNSDTTGEADTLVRGLIRFGLAAKARPELGTAYRELEPSTIRAVAEALVKAGDYGTAIRAVAPLFSRPGYIPTKRDRELYWPQAFLAETRDASERFSLPEPLLFGLVRSESLFQPAVVSRAGAVGLAQLMPATAAETAGRLRMASYDVTNPADNLTLGASYFKRILDNRNGRFMPAIFSYNAGPTRFLRWENQYGPLPQDLLLEVLDYAETRQYGRNVVAAAMAYAALYYEVDLHEFLGKLLGE